MQVMVKNPIEPLPGIKCMFITSLTKQILTTLAIWYSGNKPLKCGSISYQFGAQSRGQLCFQVCGGASEEFENVWAKWRSQWIRATRWQSLHVAGWLPGATWGAGRPPGPPHRLLHRPVRRGGRVHQKVGALIIIIIVLKDVFLSSATFVPHFKMCIFFFTITLYHFRREVDLDAKNIGGWTPLMYASYIGHDNIANLVLEAGVNVNATTAKGLTPLMLTASCGNESIAYFLLQVQNWSDSENSSYIGLFRNPSKTCSDVIYFLKQNPPGNMVTLCSDKVSALVEFKRCPIKNTERMDSFIVLIVCTFVTRCMKDFCFSYSYSKVPSWSWRTVEAGLLCFIARAQATSRWSSSCWIKMPMPMSSECISLSQN